jgi:hypothetical protein
MSSITLQSLTNNSNNSNNINTPLNSNQTNNPNNLLINRNQMASSAPLINVKQQQIQFEKLPSPKKHLFPMVKSFVQLTTTMSSSSESSKLLNQSTTSDYSSFRSSTGQTLTNISDQQHNSNTLLTSNSTSSLVSLNTTSNSSTMQNDANKLKSEIVNVLNTDYKTHMLHNQYGLPFIQNKKDIPLNCFISAEAVWWCIDHINEIESEADAILFLQICSDFDIIRHISNQQKIFIHGFYLYYIITNENRNHHLYTKDYCEVSFFHNFLNYFIR